MKYIVLILTLLSSSLLAQTGINYQGAATDSDGVKLVNQNISLRTSVLQGGVNGTISFSETHNTTTDQFGLFNVIIGQGEVVSGIFDSISWGADAHFLKVELDATGGSEYSLVSNTQMMSVPYAKYAENTSIDTNSIIKIVSDSFNLNSSHNNYKNEPINDSLVNGKRIYYLNGGNIIESDENGSFSNILIDNNNDVLAFYIDGNTIYWIEFISYYSAIIKKADLSNFIEENVTVFSTYFYIDNSAGQNQYISGFAYHNNRFYISGGSYLFYIENSVNNYIANVSSEIKDLAIDDNGTVFITVSNTIRKYEPENNESLSTIWSGGYADNIVCNTSDQKIYFNSGNNISSINYDGSNETFITNIDLYNFELSDFKISEDNEFIFSSYYLICKYKENVGLQSMIATNQETNFVEVK